LLNRALRHGKTPDIVENYRIVFKLFLSVFDLRRVHSASLDENDITSIEENALGAFVQFILKLNEQLFRPLFLRTYDWAVIELADEADAQDGLSARRIVLYKIVDRLLAQLRVSSLFSVLFINSIVLIRVLPPPVDLCPLLLVHARSNDRATRGIRKGRLERFDSLGRCRFGIDESVR